MTEFFFNGVQMSEDELNKALDESQERMIGEIRKIELEFGVSNSTACAIFYLRGRSRWTEEKEKELVTRDKIGFPISLGAVLSGDF
jgi:hypothetical protein